MVFSGSSHRVSTTTPSTSNTTSSTTTTGKVFKCDLENKLTNKQTNKQTTTRTSWTCRPHAAAHVSKVDFQRGDHKYLFVVSLGGRYIDLF